MNPNLNDVQFFHHAQKRDRASIEAGGLRPHSPFAGPRGVYLHPDLGSVRSYLKGQAMDPEKHDVWAVSVPGHWARPDPLDDRYSYVGRHITPKRVQRVESW